MVVVEGTRLDQAKTVTFGTRGLLKATSKERTTLTITAPAAATATPTGPSVTTRMEERTGTKIGTKIGIGKDMLTITSEEETMMAIGVPTTGLEGHSEAIKTTAATTQVHHLHLEEKVLWFLSVMSSETMTMTTVLGTATATRITTETETTMSMVQVEAMAITTDVTAMTEIGTSSRTLPSSAISIIEAVAEAEVAVVAGLTVDEAEEDLREAADTVAMMTAKAAIMVTTTETAAMEAAITTTTITTTTAVVTFLASVELGSLVVAAGAVAQPEEDAQPPWRMIGTERNENNEVFQHASLKSSSSF